MIIYNIQHVTSLEISPTNPTNHAINSFTKGYCYLNANIWYITNIHPHPTTHCFLSFFFNFYFNFPYKSNNASDGARTKIITVYSLKFDLIVPLALSIVGQNSSLPNLTWPITNWQLVSVAPQQFINAFELFPFFFGRS